MAKQQTTRGASMKSKSQVSGLWGGMTLKTNPRLLTEHLGRSLYEDTSLLVWEIVRNGLVACMPDPHKWAPKSTNVETRVMTGHPLCRAERALIVLDYGCGFTKNNIQRFYELGSGSNNAGNNAGASQKRLGRLALFPLSASYRDDVFDAPIFLFTRTTPTGNVTMVTLSAASLCEGKVEEKTIKPNASELGPFVGIKGTFSMFVIPNTVVESNEELYDALKWRVPRDASKSVNLTVNNQKVTPPALAKHAFNAGNGITAYLDRNLDAGSIESGIWLCDAETGLRCSLATKLNPAFLPYPLNSPLLKGDIMIPGILQQQDTSRGNLNSSYLRSKAWTKIIDQLRLHLVSYASKILGDADEFKSRDPINKCIQEMVQAFTNAFGAPIYQFGEGDEPFGATNNQPTGSTNNNPTPRPPRGDKPSGPRSPTTEKPKRRGYAVHIGDHDYLIVMTPRPSDKDVFGVLSVGEDVRRLQFNPDYELLKKLKGPSQREHMFLRFIELIAEHEYPDHALKRQKHASQLRARVGNH
ncbi:MAG TPA: hypothetical protein PLR08_00525 [bacterium]|nr:hypothetical protein [Candidatus Magasanikbacteria bacterium]HPF95021.1 hypothetical protein [bacterium]